MDREAFIALLKETAKPQITKLTLPGLGEVFVRAPTVAEVDLLNQRRKDGAEEKDRFARAAARLLCLEDGTRLLDDNDEAFIELLSKSPWATISQILDAADPARHSVAKG